MLALLVAELPAQSSARGSLKGATLWPSALKGILAAKSLERDLWHVTFPERSAGFRALAARAHPRRKARFQEVTARANLGIQGVTACANSPLGHCLCKPTCSQGGKHKPLLVAMACCASRRFGEAMRPLHRNHLRKQRALPGGSVFAHPHTALVTFAGALPGQGVSDRDPEDSSQAALPSCPLLARGRRLLTRGPGDRNDFHGA